MTTWSLCPAMPASCLVFVVVVVGLFSGVYGGMMLVCLVMCTVI